MKMSRRDRKMFNAGKQAGYAAGYAQGLHDGNPFIVFAEAITETVNKLGDVLTDPEVIKAMEEAKRSKENTMNGCTPHAEESVELRDAEEYTEWLDCQEEMEDKE